MIQKKIILIYNKMWDCPLDIPYEQIPPDYIITTDRNLYDKADVVVFHMPTLYHELSGDLNKHTNQKWVAWYLESEANYPFLKDQKIMSLFDYHMSYRQKAEIIYPYYQYDHIDIFHKEKRALKKKGNVCMMVSRPFNKSHRLEYIQELMKYIKIDSYGKVFNNKRLENDTGQTSKLELYRNYKFVIAFENSIETDYVTEKFFDPLSVCSVPIYYGAPNIKEFMPGENCFIDVRDFNNPYELSLYINDCCNDDSLYQTFFYWRDKPLCHSFIQKAVLQYENLFIRLCKFLSSR